MKSTKNQVKNLVTTDYSLLAGDALIELDKIPDETVSLIITSPPYNIGKEYEKMSKMSLNEYLIWLDEIIEKLVAKVSPTGSVCWQVGNYIKDKEVFPLDIFFYELFKKRNLQLKNRIIWRFNFGYNAESRFSGRYETLLWFTKTNKYTFNLDPIRVPQLYPGKRHSTKRSKKSGELSGNPKGKNPSDYWEFLPDKCFLNDPVWELPNIKANHPEKTIHPCQFPIELAERCVLALTSPKDVVLDPFVGTGSSVIASIKHNRIGIGIDNNKEYIKLTKSRIEQFKNEQLKMRPSGKPIRKPKTNEKVAQYPSEWLK